MLFTVEFLKKPKTKPIKANAIKKIAKEKLENETSKPVTVVPKKEPSMIEKP